MRELRQHASRYLARVAAGESIEVTDRGRAVAQLVPVTGDSWADLLASGRVSRPTSQDDLLDVVTPISLPPGARGISDVLAAMRADER